MQEAVERERRRMRNIALEFRLLEPLMPRTPLQISAQEDLPIALVKSVMVSLHSAS